MDEYLCLTVRSRPGEPEKEFAGRLSQFWTHMLRNRTADYEKVYAEARAFESEGDFLVRKYLLEEGVADVLEAELDAQGLDFIPIDRDDVYSKYEAVVTEWMQIEH